MVEKFRIGIWRASKNFWLWTLVMFCLISDSNSDRDSSTLEKFFRMCLNMF